MNAVIPQKKKNYTKGMTIWVLKPLLGVLHSVIRYTWCAYCGAHLCQIFRCASEFKWYKSYHQWMMWYLQKKKYSKNEYGAGFLKPLLGVLDSVIRYTGCGYCGAYLCQIFRCASECKWYKSYHQWMMWYLQKKNYSKNEYGSGFLKPLLGMLASVIKYTLCA